MYTWGVEGGPNFFEYILHIHSNAFHIAHFTANDLKNINCILFWNFLKCEILSLFLSMETVNFF